MFSAKLINGIYLVFPMIQTPHNNLNPSSAKKISNSNQVFAFNVNSVIT